MRVFDFVQTGFTLVSKILAGQEAALRTVLEQIGANPESNGILPFGKLTDLHYASLVLVPIRSRAQDARLGALGDFSEEPDGGWRLVFEGNIDGTVGAFLTQMNLRLHDGLVQIYSHCDGFAEGSALAYLLASNLGPGALYVGTPGRRVEQIRQEQALRDSIEACLSSDPGKEKGRSWILSQAAVKGSDVAGKGYEPPWQVKAGSAPLIGLAVVLLLAIAIALGLVIHFGSGAGFKRSFVFGLLALVVVTAASALILYELLIRSQASDPSYPNNRFGPHTVPCIAQEDKGVSNHFVSVTKIKPGAFRSLLSRTILFVVKYYTIFFANTGTLSGIPSIHFARWILIEGDTLVFFTNFGGTWDSYLDDFIYRAHTGLTAIWSNSMGFPKTTGLFADGAQQELAFKVYARNSQTPTQVWYQAYPGMSTANIDNNTRIREGLSGNMSAQEEDRWLARL